MAAKILDYERPGKDSRRSGAYPQSDPPPRQPDVAIIPPLAPAHRQEDEAAYLLPKRALDYPAITDWLKSCEDDLERGRDNHDYTALSSVFATNGCTRIDDITRLTGEAIKALADEQGVKVTIGIANRVHAYWGEYAARVWGGRGG